MCMIIDHKESSRAARFGDLTVNKPRHAFQFLIIPRKFNLITSIDTYCGWGYFTVEFYTYIRSCYGFSMRRYLPKVYMVPRERCTRNPPATVKPARSVRCRRVMTGREHRASRTGASRSCVTVDPPAATALYPDASASVAPMSGCFSITVYRPRLRPDFLVGVARGSLPVDPRSQPPLTGPIVF